MHATFGDVIYVYSSCFFTYEIKRELWQVSFSRCTFVINSETDFSTKL